MKSAAPKPGTADSNVYDLKLVYAWRASLGVERLGKICHTLLARKSGIGGD